MKKHALCGNTIFMLVLCFTISFGQINVSETFQKVLKKIAKERVKNEVITWVTEQDPTSGIIARDLIAQLLDGKDEQTLLRSTTNVVTTTMFLCGIKKYVYEIIDSTQEVLEQAKTVGWTKDQVVSYSCLYYYYSERLKYNLYVSPEILKMSQEKSRIESFKSKEGRKWTVIVSAKLVSQRYMNKDLSVDVRLLEALDNSLWALISDRNHYVMRTDSIFASLIEAYSDPNFRQLLSAFNQNTKPGMLIANLFDIYRKAYEKAQVTDRVFSAVASNLVQDASINESFASNILVGTYTNLVASARYEFVDHQQLNATILGSVKDLLEYWMSRGRENGWKVDYIFSLAGTGIGGSSSSVDFTILDQIRLVKNFENTKVFIYCGGFFDPLLKSTIYNSGAKIYLIGLGFGWHAVYFAVSGGIEYPEINIRNTRLAFSLGYEIPISDLFD